ncbi:MAG: L-threonylcarbamoyladenylate synthase [bacterium]|nr:L-threonylcarbamoyladenylate synthase [bacterium]
MPMLTKQLSVSHEHLDASIQTAAQILKNGGLVAIPTETVYGLAANALDEEAVKKIFSAKGRPQDNPLIVHASSLKVIEKLVKEIPPAAKKCAEAFWPGPFTMVLPKSDIIPNTVCAGLDTVAVRIPKNNITQKLLAASQLVLAAPSANISGSPSPTTFEHVLNDLDGKIDAVLMGERCAVGVESTVVTFATNPPRLLRPGGITIEQLREFIPDLVIDKAIFSEPKKNVAVASPGMKYKHYSPKAKIIVVEADRESFETFVSEQRKVDPNIFALCFDESNNRLGQPLICCGQTNDSISYAARLFDALRELDLRGCKLCYAISPGKQGVGLAVYNRLLRAAAFEVISL